MSSEALQEVVALLGCPAAGHPAQFLFGRLFEAAGLDWQFVTCDVPVDRLAEALGGLTALGFRGCILSGPLREAALPVVGSASPSAVFAAAVGVCVLEPADRSLGGLTGHMTDGRAVVEAIRSHVDPAGARVLVVGSGAAARATALELSLARAGEILLFDRAADRVAAVVEAVSALGSTPATAVPWNDTIMVPEGVGIVITALPSDGPKPPAQLGGLRPDLVVADLALRGQPSPVIAMARAAGACCVDGLEIHTARTAIDFQTLTGSEADPEVIRDALDEFFSV